MANNYIETKINQKLRKISELYLDLVNQEREEGDLEDPLLSIAIFSDGHFSYYSIKRAGTKENYMLDQTYYLNHFEGANDDDDEDEDEQEPDA